MYWWWKYLFKVGQNSLDGKIWSDVRPLQNERVSQFPAEIMRLMTGCRAQRLCYITSLTCVHTLLSSSNQKESESKSICGKVTNERLRTHILEIQSWLLKCQVDKLDLSCGTFPKTHMPKLGLECRFFWFFQDLNPGSTLYNSLIYFFWVEQHWFTGISFRLLS